LFLAPDKSTIRARPPVHAIEGQVFQWAQEGRTSGRPTSVVSLTASFVLSLFICRIELPNSNCYNIKQKEWQFVSLEMQSLKQNLEYL
jgi:hypothetical protein